MELAGARCPVRGSASGADSKANSGGRAQLLLGIGTEVHDADHRSRGRTSNPKQTEDVGGKIGALHAANVVGGTATRAASAEVFFVGHADASENREGAAAPPGGTPGHPADDVVGPVPLYEACRDVRQ